MRRIHISDIMIVRRFPRPKRDTRRTAKGVGAKVVSKLGPLIRDEFPSKRHVFHGVHVQVLIIGQDQDDVGSLSDVYAALYWIS